jgi:hypothetical protein
MQRIKTEILLNHTLQTVAILEVLKDEEAYALNLYLGHCNQPQLPRHILLITEHLYDVECLFEKEIKKTLSAGFSFLINGENVQIMGFDSFLNPIPQNAPEVKACTQPKTTTFRKLR